MKLSISFASRNRPASMVETISRTLKNIVLPDTRFVVALDVDDKPSIEAAQQFGDQIILSIEPRPDTIAEKWNRVLKLAPAHVYLTQSDYVYLATKGFDERALEAAALFPDGIGVVYNHMANLSFSEINAVTAGLVRYLGYIYPPYFPYWFVDHWLDDIARIINRIAVADVRCSVLHGKITQEMREPPFWATFYDAMAPMRRQIAHRIINDIEFREPAWRKQLLLSHHPLIEERSVMVNNAVRNMTGSPLDLTEPRYVRIKQQAVAMLKNILREPMAEVA